MTLLARLMSDEEGYNVLGSIPQRQNNPLDLRHAPLETHPPDSPDSVGSFATSAQGWAMGERQLQLYAERGLTLEQMVYEFAPPSDNNDTLAYLNFICKGGGWTSDTPVAQALETA
jgi:hypothetical protein